MLNPLPDAVVSAPSPAPVVLTAHARSVPAADRAHVAAEIRRLVGSGALVIETCHRVEGYAVGDDAGNRLRSIDLPPGAGLLRGAAAIRHPIAVAVGRDSVVVGEEQVLHQVRAAVDAARRAGTLEPVLERLFAAALRAGREARSWQRGPVRSLATVALDEAERRAGTLRGRTVLIVGAGRMGRLAARAAAERGAAILVASRTGETAAAVAADVGGRSVPLTSALGGSVAAIVVALAGPWPLDASSAAGLAETPVVIDLSVPAAIPDVFTRSLGSRLVTADDLATGDHPSAVDATQLARLDRLIDRATGEFVEWLEGHDRRAVAEALARRVDRARDLELDALWRRLPGADEETRAAIESMARHLGQRLLREPLERLRNDPDGSGERAVREVFSL